MGIGDRIKQIRSSFRQEVFAEKIGVHVNTVGRWEREQRTPDVDDLNKILAVFTEVSADWLLTGKGEMVRGKGGYFFEGLSFEERLFIDVVQAGLETKGIEYPDSREQAARAYDLYRLIYDLRKDALPTVDEIKEMYGIFSAFYKKIGDGDTAITESNMHKIIEQIIKGRTLNKGCN